MRRRPPLPRLLLLAASLTVAIAFGTAAEAQLGDVGQQNQVDTANTPVAKPSQRWKWYAGARFVSGGPNDARVPVGSVTPFELDLLDVAFREQDYDLDPEERPPEHGFAGGAVCRDRFDPEDPASVGKVRGCERVPALYEYSVDAEGEKAWSPVDLGQSADARGYVGAIAWLDSDHALAVGGTGCYPRREEPCPGAPAAEPNAGDPIAGRARAWVYQDWDGGGTFEWRELQDLPPTMRGLTAASQEAKAVCNEGTGKTAVVTQWGCAAAGGLRQVWHFRDGAVVTGWSGDGSAPRNVVHPELFQFRVRDISGATAVTAGCCVTDPTVPAGGRTLSFNGADWSVGGSSATPTSINFGVSATLPPVGDTGSTANDPIRTEAQKQGQRPLGGPWDQGRAGYETGRSAYDGGKAWYDLTRPAYGWPEYYGKPVYTDGYFPLCGSCAAGVPPPESVTGVPWPSLPENPLPESWPASPVPPNPLPRDPTSGADQAYDGAYRQASGSVYGVTSPFAPVGVNPSQAANTHTQFQDPDSFYALYRLSVPVSAGATTPSTAFGTVASAGGPSPAAGQDEPVSKMTPGGCCPQLSSIRLVGADRTPVKEGVEAVGVLRSSGRGVAWGTSERTPLGDKALHGCNTPSTANPELKCEPNADRYVADQASVRLFSMPSYALNAVDVSDDETGAGWAVGDYGAILSLAGRTVAQTSPEGPEPPALEHGAQREFSSSGSFDQLRPTLSPRPGQVPALASQPVEQLDGPQMVSAGSPDATHSPGANPPLPGGFDPWHRVEMEDVSEIVMSRDGSEGWAVGSNPIIGGTSNVASNFYGSPSVFHYDGVSWGRCDIKGAPGFYEPDPECAALAPFAVNSVTSNRVRRTTLIAAERIPYERDDDPGNDDDFEIVALTSDSTGKIARMKDGRWRIDTGLSDALESIRKKNPFSYSNGFQLVDIAFTAPDDGWVLAYGQSGYQYLLMHWDGADWSLCDATPKCGNGRLPSSSIFNGRLLGLEAAGDRVYTYGWRWMNTAGAGSNDSALTALPMIVYRDRKRGVWTDGSGAGEDGGGYDPGFGATDPGLNTGRVSATTAQGKVVALSVAQRPGGGYQGWAVGRFFTGKIVPGDDNASINRRSEVRAYPDQHSQGVGGGDEPSAIAMRLGEDADGKESWGLFKDPGALNDFMSPAMNSDQTGGDNKRPLTEPRLMTTLGDGRSFVAQRGTGMLFGFDPGRGRFDVVQSQRPPGPASSRYLFGSVELHGLFQSLAPDGHGGFWAAVKNSDWQGEMNWTYGGQVYFFHYTDRRWRPVFREVAQPFGGGLDRINGLSGSGDGLMWASTDGGRLARYDRLLGWQVVSTIPGWDPGKTVTARTRVAAVAVGADGTGVAVGPKGRIADLSSGGVRLDQAAGTRCGGEVQAPCGTGFDLRAAAVAPDGAALAGGDELTLLWRPGGDEFRRIAKPRGAPRGDRAVEIVYPTPDRAYVRTEAGYIFAGESMDWGWRWRADNLDAKGIPFATVYVDDLGRRVGHLQALAIDRSGHGYGVGKNGLVFERTGAGVWRRLRGPGTDDLYSVALTPDGTGAVIGGDSGVIWTLTDGQFGVVRPADYSRGPTDPYYNANQRAGENGALTGAITALALVPGVEDGQLEAWAVSEARGPGTNRLFHYTSDPNEPLLNPDRRARALPDAPEERPGEVAFAAFGNSDCDLRGICLARRGTLNRYEVIGERIVSELKARFSEPGSGFALFTGDATFTAGLPASSTHRSDRVGSPEGSFSLAAVPSTNPYGIPEEALAPVMQRQWNRLIADPLDEGGVPLFGTPGPGDLSRPLYRCDPVGVSAIANNCGPVGAANGDSRTGDNLSWRDAMAVRRAPWGAVDRKLAGALSFVPVEGSQARAVQLPEQRLDPDGTGSLPETKVGGGARTHYAVDVVRDGKPVARLVVLDTSLRSLSDSDPLQQPVEAGGQLGWLERMICLKGGATDVAVDALGRCTREPGEKAIVLTSTPTYSYGVTSPNEIDAKDGIQLEALLLKYQASVVVSGRLGWNARYWATAAGVHEPCPGGAYQDTPPAATTRICGRGETDQATAGAEQVAQALGGLGVSAPPAVDDALGQVTDVTGLLPFVVAGGGGGPLGTSDAEEGQQKPADGYWNGYTIVRLPANGDPRGVVVEQRPLLDWISLTAQENVLRPGQKMTLRGVGREPIGYGSKVMTRFDELTSAAITHRYDLVMADPQKPYVPVEDANGEYVPVPPRVATVDPQTGAVKAGGGRGERTYALAILSVGDRAATWPIAFEPRRSFTPQRGRVVLPPLPRVARAPAAQPPIRVSDAPAPPPPPPPATPASPFSAQTLQPPQPPQIPSLPAANAPPAPAPPQLQAPPAPPAPPPPPSVPPQQQPLPLTLNAKLQAISLVPSVNPPAPPPVNPAPPAGGAARKEAKQRQAAAAKSEESGGEGSSAQADVNTVTDPSNSASRLDNDGGRYAFTRLERSSGSPVAQGALYAGGTAALALLMALGWGIARPRRRPPVVPAPARATFRGR